ncbi:hypothetical protein [Streptomyces sp. RPT161]|uniref:hypothetical protein n=1 Tax=Streptomyces sp. RPT161 TaxID=3015993 RepID=UPI0022B8A27C|nr:hypothetical protein [Streptomyces sp. RPT161]
MIQPSQPIQLTPEQFDIFRAEMEEHNRQSAPNNSQPHCPRCVQRAESISATNAPHYILFFEPCGHQFTLPNTAEWKP